MLRAVLGSRSAPVLLSLGGGAALALYMWRRRLSSAATTIKPLILFDVDGTLAVPYADTYRTLAVPYAGTYRLRVPASCVAYVPEAQGSCCATVRTPYAYPPRVCRTYRVPWHHR